MNFAIVIGIGIVARPSRPRRGHQRDTAAMSGRRIVDRHGIGLANAVRRILARSLRAVVLAAALTSCQTVKDAGSTLFSGNTSRGPGLDAPLGPIGGSAADGSVRFIARADGVTMLVSLAGVAPGQYRVLVHANGNCSSRNGFSAGPPWSPPGAVPPLPERMPAMTANSEGSGTMTARIANVALDGPNGLMGKSVIVHEADARSFEAQPGVPNGRIACGVIGVLRPLF